MGSFLIVLFVNLLLLAHGGVEAYSDLMLGKDEDYIFLTIIMWLYAAWGIFNLLF